MAKAKSAPASETKTEMVELSLMIVPRGKSVVHGTMLVNGALKNFKHDLSDHEKSLILEVILNDFVL